MKIEIGQHTGNVEISIHQKELRELLRDVEIHANDSDIVVYDRHGPIDIADWNAPQNFVIRKQ